LKASNRSAKRWRPRAAGTKYIDNRNVAQAAQDRYNQSPPPDDYTLWERTWDQDIYKERMDRLPGNKAVMAVGFAGAGVCLAAGTVLVVLGEKKEKGQRGCRKPQPHWARPDSDLLILQPGGPRATPIELRGSPGESGDEIADIFCESVFAAALEWGCNAPSI
jgi:hypothetical protein